TAGQFVGEVRGEQDHAEVGQVDHPEHPPGGGEPDRHHGVQAPEQHPADRRLEGAHASNLMRRTSSVWPCLHRDLLVAPVSLPPQGQLAGGTTSAAARSCGHTMTHSPSWICLIPTLVCQKLLTAWSKVRWPLNVVSTPFSVR